MTREEYLKLLYEAILNELGISEEMLKSPTRLAKYVDARKIFSYLCKEKGFSYTQISHLLNRNHSSILAYMEKFKNAYEYDKILREKFFKVQLYMGKKQKEQDA